MDPGAPLVESAPMTRLRHVASVLGPGVILAGTAIGVSHLVQATRAGATYGLALLVLLIAANLLKAPFFEFAHRYTASTGQNLLQGYYALGRGWLALFAIVTLVNMIAAIASLGLVSGGLAAHLMPSVGLTSHTWALLLLSGCTLMVVLGRYPLLDGLTKVLVAVLTVTTLITAFAAAAHGPVGTVSEPSSPWTLAALPFVVALLGWMPAPIDGSVFPSLWLDDLQQRRGSRVPLADTLVDFWVGYGLSTLTAVCFLVIGALVLHGTDTELSGAPHVFAGQLADAFGASLGAWVVPLVSVGAFAAVFSTTLTCVDGYPRCLAASLAVLTGRPSDTARFMTVLVPLVVLAAMIVLWTFSDFRPLLDTAATLAFVAAPLFGALNLAAIRRVPPEAAPPRWLVAGAWLGLLFLSVLTALFLWTWVS